MAWILFLISLVVAWDGLAAESHGLAGAIIQTIFLLTGIVGMIAAMYLRSIGW